VSLPILPDQHRPLLSVHLTLLMILRSAFGAGNRNRTRNLLFTKQLLCQLSYAGLLTER
jgi:hypothetical protein